MDKLFKTQWAEKRSHDGPLGQYIDRFSEFLRDRGNSVATTQSQIRLIADLSRWLDRRRLKACDLDEATIDVFIKARHQKMHFRVGDRLVLRLLQQHLQKFGVLPVQTSLPVQVHPLEHAFAQYLECERGVARITLVNYLFFVRIFLSEQSIPDTISGMPIGAESVIQFVLRHARSHSPEYAKHLVTALRAFFHFLQFRGDTTSDLASCVPAVSCWKMTTLPQSLRQDEVENVLKSFNTQRRAGLRDLAILLLISRLGLRAGEVANLELDDLHWEAGEITVRGKGHRENRFPLPRDVGKALVAYLQLTRPLKCGTRRLFIRTYPPFTGFATSVAVTTLVRRALVRSGLHLPRMGAHLFRHTLASQMLRRGATLVEIGGVLRHRNPDTTTIYAKVDLSRLRDVTQPWPGGQS
jgi:site-specific recombinase XerD